MSIKETATKRLSFNDHMDRWYAAHPEIIRVDWPEEVKAEADTPIVKVRIVETGKKHD